MPRRWVSIRGDDRNLPSEIEIPRPYTGNDAGHIPKTFAEPFSRDDAPGRHLPLVVGVGRQNSNQADQTNKTSTVSTSTHGASQCTSTHKRRWRKLSEVFRPNSETGKQSTQLQPLRPTTDERKLKVPVATEITATITPPQTLDRMLQDDGQYQENDLCTSEVQPLVQNDDFSPQLQVDIPLTPLERFSVMFQDIHGGLRTTSSLGQRKSTAQETLPNADRNRAKRLGIANLKRPATSPTITHFECALVNTSNQNRRSSKYSLFPSTPVPGKPRSIHSSLAQNRHRSFTAPADLQILLTGAAETGAIVPQQSQQYLQQVPEILYTDPPVPTQTQQHIHKKSLSNNSENEIFFDIKSFRGSNGMEGSQFEMTRPPSSIVQVVRSKSNARRTVNRKPLPTTAQNYVAYPSPEIYELSADTCAQIDETIAMVEHLTSPVSNSPNPETLEFYCQLDHEEREDTDEDTFETSDQEKPLQVDLSSNQINQEVTENDDLLKIDKSTSQVQNVEAEETMDDVELSVQSTVVIDKNSVSLKMNSPPNFSTPSRTATQLRTNTGYSKSSTTQPTAVPLSRYASTKVKEDVVWQNFVRPVPLNRCGRSKTETNVNCHLTGQRLARIPYSKRASSMPDAFSQPLVSGDRISTRGLLDTSSTSGDHAVISAEDMCAKLAAEVSIARQVSVVRRQNAKIIEPRANTKVQPLSVLKEMERSVSVQQSRDAEMERRAAVGKKLPSVQEVHRKHKPGCSIDIVLDSATTGSTTSLPQHQGGNSELANRLEKALPPIPVS